VLRIICNQCSVMEGTDLARKYVTSCFRHFRFKLLYVPAIQVQTLNRLHVDRVCWL